MAREEQAFLKLCERAGLALDRFSYIEEQRSHGWSEHFATAWRNALGTLTERSMKAFLFVWKRWELHAANCKTY